MVQPETQRFGERRRAGVGDDAGSRALRRAPRPRPTALRTAAVVAGSSAPRDCRQAHPPRAVGRVGHRRARDRRARSGCRTSARRRRCGEHVDGNVAPVCPQPGVVGRAEVRPDRLTKAIGDVAHQDSFGVFAASAPAAAPTSDREWPVAVSGRDARTRPTIAGNGVDTGRNIQWHSGIGSEPFPAGPQQPAVQPGPFHAGPRRGGRVLERPDFGRAYRRVGQHPQRDDVGGRELRRPRPSSSAPAPPGRPPAGVPPHRSAAGPSRRGAGSEPSPACPGPATRSSVTERVRPFTRQPRQAGNAPAVRLDGAFRAAGVAADETVQVQKAIQVPGFVLQHAREQAGALDGRPAGRRRPAR